MAPNVMTTLLWSGGCDMPGTPPMAMAASTKDLLEGIDLIAGLDMLIGFETVESLAASDENQAPVPKAAQPPSRLLIDF